ncbi:hypothetical protein AB0H36_13440 [Kribbella sp. NPDC050820]
MSEQRPGPPPMPGAPAAYAPPQARAISAGYRRWARILSWLAIVIRRS